jgi:hypothetical protein
MKILKGQRWIWDNSIFIEVSEDSKEFDPIATEILVKGTQIGSNKNGEGQSRYSSSWYFGLQCWSRWVYLKGQDAS